MKHWLQIGGIKTNLKSEAKQWNNLFEYLKSYPGSKAIVYVKNTGDMFCEIIELICEQDYASLDLDCNSMFDGSIKHLGHKPSDISICKKQVEYFRNKHKQVLQESIS